MAKHILVTGGTGYIGSHTVVALLQAGYQVTILDDLSNSTEKVIDAIAAITSIKPRFVLADVCDETLLDKLFKANTYDAVMHFAGLKAVGESTEKPLVYYHNNVNGSISLLQAMQRADVKTFIFSSSATVYGNPQFLPLTEDHPRSATNPYGHSKLIVEDILESLYNSQPGWRIARLRYFNPVGAHKSGLIGESPKGIPNNLMPYVAQVAAGIRKSLRVYGNDYETPDGTGVRDYIHVADLADGHIKALQFCEAHAQELLTVNLGTGNGFSVLDMVQAFEGATGTIVPYAFSARRSGDIASCWADATLAYQRLNWRAARGIKEMCEDAWRWQAR